MENRFCDSGGYYHYWMCSFNFSNYKGEVVEFRLIQAEGEKWEVKTPESSTIVDTLEEALEEVQSLSEEQE